LLEHSRRRCARLSTPIWLSWHSFFSCTWMSTSDGPGQGGLGLIAGHELAQKPPQFAAEFTDETGRQKRNEAAESTPSIAPNLGVRTPQIQESPACTTNGVGAGKGKSPHSFLIGKRRRAPANVPMLIGRISANHQKILAAPEVAMPCPGWQHGKSPACTVTSRPPLRPESGVHGLAQIREPRAPWSGSGESRRHRCATATASHCAQMLARKQRQNRTQQHRTPRDKEAPEAARCWASAHSARVEGPRAPKTLRSRTRDDRSEVLGLQAWQQSVGD
jgi:hypothetical protein